METTRTIPVGLAACTLIQKWVDLNGDHQEVSFVRDLKTQAQGPGRLSPLQVAHLLRLLDRPSAQMLLESLGFTFLASVNAALLSEHWEWEPKVHLLGVAGVFCRRQGVRRHSVNPLEVTCSACQAKLRKPHAWPDRRRVRKAGPPRMHLLKAGQNLCKIDCDRQTVNVAEVTCVTCLRRLENPPRPKAVRF